MTLHRLPDAPDGPSSDALETSGLNEAEARLYARLAVARLEGLQHTTDHDELVVLMVALETLEALRRGTAGLLIAPHLNPDEVAHLTLDDALEATRLAVIALAVGGDLTATADVEGLDALTSSLERLRRLAPPDPQPAEPHPLEAVAGAGAELLRAVEDNRVTREHLAGRLEPLRGPLERLEHALDRAGVVL